MGLKRALKKVSRALRSHAISQAAASGLGFHTFGQKDTQKGGVLAGFGRMIGGKKGGKQVGNIGKEMDRISTWKGSRAALRSMQGKTKEEKATQQNVAAQEAASAEEMMRRYRRRSQQSLRTSGMG